MKQGVQNGFGALWETLQINIQRPKKQYPETETY